MILTNRISSVDDVAINDIVLSSNFQIGDSTFINARSYAFAVQRSHEEFYGYEGNLHDYAIFSEVIPIPPIFDEVTFNRYNANPCIHVSHVNIIGISASSIFHIGNTKDVYLEGRIHHIRQLEKAK